MVVYHSALQVDPEALKEQGREASWLETFVFPGYDTPLRPLDSLLPQGNDGAADRSRL